MKRVRQFFSRYRSGLQRAGAVLLALAVWQGLAMGVGQKLLVPSPLSVVERLGGIWQEADFWGTVWFPAVQVPYSSPRAVSMITWSPTLSFSSPGEKK